MTSRHGLPLPGVRELFPDLFRPRSMTTLQTPPPATYDQQRTTYDMTNLPPVSTPRHPRPAPSHRSTAQNTATRTADHPYTRFNSPVPSSSHTQPHGTRQWPNPDVVASTHTPHVSPTCTSPEVSSPYSPPRPQRVERWGVGQSGTIQDNEQPSSPMTSSPQTASNLTEFAPQPSSFEQKSVETHSGKKRHKCDVCGSYWGRPSSLKIHMVSHTGVKEFMCSICKQDFGVKSNYTRHIRVHHKDSSEGIQTRVAGRRRRGSRRNQDGGPVRFVDEGPRFQGQ
jgi:hypothetical protein